LAAARRRGAAPRAAQTKNRSATPAHHDGYRPWYVTKIFWDANSAEGKIFVADPAQGSRHNRGCAWTSTFTT